MDLYRAKLKAREQLTVVMVTSSSERGFCLFVDR